MLVREILNYHKGALAKCRPADSLQAAAEAMAAHDVNGLAVIQENGSLVGILTDHDIIRALVARKGPLEETPVFERMTQRVTTCSMDTKLTAALALMGRHKIRHLVVVEDDRPVAVLSIKDVLQQIHEAEKLELSVLRDIAMASRAAVPA